MGVFPSGDIRHRTRGGVYPGLSYYRLQIPVADGEAIFLFDRVTLDAARAP